MPRSTPPRAPRVRSVSVFSSTLLSPLMLAVALAAEPVPVEIPREVTGKTPTLIGYNMGENFPGSGVTHWLAYSGMNCARFWWPREAWAERPPTGRGAPSSEEELRAAQAALRANPEEESRRHEEVIARHFGPVPEGTKGHVFSLSELRRLGVTVLSPMTHRVSDWPFDRMGGSPDWYHRWAYWRGVYLNVFYLARTYDMERFQLFNEPDHRSNDSLSQEEYLRRMQLGADAVHAALADVNRIYGRNLVPHVSAPVSAGIEIYRPRSGRPDKRDSERGWGEMLVAAMHADFPGRTMPDAPMFEDYAIQFYTRSRDSVVGGIGRVRAAMAEDLNGNPLPIIASEMNVSTAANFGKTEETLDSPSYYGPWGTLAVAAVDAGLKEIYVFRLTQSPNRPGGLVKKNGTHVFDLADPLQRITHLTRGGAVARLFMHTMSGARDLLARPAGLPEGMDAAAARDPRTGEFTMLMANPTEAEVSLELDWKAWPELAGARVEVSEVSTQAHGDLVGLEPLDEERKLVLKLEPAANVALRVVPGAAPLAEGAPWTLAADGRWYAVGPSPAYVRVVTAKTEEPVILRVWQEDADGNRVRLLGHVVTTGKPQWVSTSGMQAGARLWIETEGGNIAASLIRGLVPVIERQ